MNFKKGDIITGSFKRDCYTITTAEALMRVTRVEATDRMEVRVIEHNGDFRVSKRNENNEFNVRTKYFKKIPKIERALRFNK